MPKRADILAWFGEVNSGYIHPFGESATEALIQKAELKGHEKVLEVGFGTGATLVKLKSRYPGIELHGVEYSKGMFEKTRRRLKFCGLPDKVRLYLENTGGGWLDIPNDFDLIFAESVLAIQEGNALEAAVRLIHGKLKTGGKLILNELVWKAGTPPEIIADINERGKTGFGCIQANGLYPTMQDWAGLLEKYGFRVLECEIMQMENLPKPGFPAFKTALLQSKIYTRMGSIKRWLNSRLYDEWKGYKNKMAGEFKNNGRYLEPVLIVLVKSA